MNDSLNKKPEVTFVDARADHTEESIETLTDAYSVYGIQRSFWERRLASDPESRFSQIRVGLIGNVVVAVLRFYWRDIVVGGVTIPSTVIGDVAVRRGFQGHKVGYALMQDAVSYLSDRGIILAWLGGRLSFYRKFNFFLFPQRAVVIEKDSCKSLVSDGEVFCGLDRLLEDNKWCSLWNEHVKDCFSKVIRTENLGRFILTDRAYGETGTKAVVHIRDKGGIIAYAMATRGPDSILVQEVAWAPEHITAVEPILSSLARIWDECKYLTVEGPIKSELTNLLEKRNVRFEIADTKRLTMASVINLHKFVEVMFPVWRTKLKKIEFSAVPLVFQDQDGSAILVDWKADEVRVLDRSPLTDDLLKLALDRDEVLRLFLGYSTAKQLNLQWRLNLDSRASDTINALFAEDSGFFGGLERA